MTNPDNETMVAAPALTQPDNKHSEHDLKTQLISIASELDQALPSSESCTHSQARKDWPGLHPDHYSHRPLPSEKAYRWVGSREDGSELLYARYRQAFLGELSRAKSALSTEVWQNETTSVGSVSSADLRHSVVGQMAAIVSYMTFCPDMSDNQRKMLSGHFKTLGTYTGGKASGVVSRSESKYAVKLMAADKAIMATISHFADVLAQHDSQSAADQKTGTKE